MSAAAPLGQTAWSCGPAKLTGLQILSPAGASEPPAHTASYKTYKRILNFDSFIRRVPLHKCPGPSQACHHLVSLSRKWCCHGPYSTLPAKEGPSTSLPAITGGGLSWWAQGIWMGTQWQWSLPSGIIQQSGGWPPLGAQPPLPPLLLLPPQLNLPGSSSTVCVLPASSHWWWGSYAAA